MPRTPQLGALLQDERLTRELTIATIASEVGVSRQQVMRWEAGENAPEGKNAVALEKLFGLQRGIVIQLALAEAQLAEAREVAARLPELEERIGELLDALRDRQPDASGTPG